MKEKIPDDTGEKLLGLKEKMLKSMTSLLNDTVSKIKSGVEVSSSKVKSLLTYFRKKFDSFDAKKLVQKQFKQLGSIKDKFIGLFKSAKDESIVSRSVLMNEVVDYSKVAKYDYHNKDKIVKKYEKPSYNNNGDDDFEEDYA